MRAHYILLRFLHLFASNSQQLGTRAGTDPTGSKPRCTAELSRESETDRLLHLRGTHRRRILVPREVKPFSTQHVGIKATAAYATRIRAEQLCRNN